MGILLSFNRKDEFLAQALQASLLMLEPDLPILFSPVSFGAVSFPSNIAKGISEADAFLLLIGPHSIGAWQILECGMAIDRKTVDSSFIVLPVLAAGSQAPPLSLLRNLDWLEVPVVTDRKMLRLIIAALKGASAN